MAALWIAGDRPVRRWPGRRGVGTVVALVIWVMALALVYALSQSQAQSGALGGVMRVTALRTVMTAGQSALVEATHRLRHPQGGTSPLLQALLEGESSGQAHDPQASRDAYQELKLGGTLTIDFVTYQVAARPPDDSSTDPYQIDLSVKVQFTSHARRGGGITRQLKRRLTGRIVRVGSSMGRSEGKDVHRALYLHPDPIAEMVE